MHPLLLRTLFSNPPANPHPCIATEGQFFPDLPEFCEALLAAGKTVLVAALDGDFRRRPFGRVLELM